MPLFGGKHKTPHESVKGLKENLQLISQLGDNKDEATTKKATKVPTVPQLK